MYTIKITLLTLATFILMTSCNAVNNPKTTTYKVYGNCGMCKKTIEKAITVKKIAKGDWNKDTKILTLTFDSTKTNPEEILKRVGLAGYDNELFYAPDDTYAKLPSCCQYDRRPKPSEMTKTVTPATIVTDTVNKTTTTISNSTPQPKAESTSIAEVVNTYYAIKNALVKTDGKTASLSAKKMLTAIASIKVESLSEQEKKTWTMLSKDIQFDAEHIEETKDPKHQRDHFSSLSKNIYTLVKSSKSSSPVYYQHCPMAFDGKGANWLSTEKAIKNPYYGSMMLNCGSVVETIK